MSYYLPAKLNPQGWLNDMVLPKIYNPKSKLNDDAGPLQDALYFENFPGIANKIVSLHPEYRNIFIQSMQKVTNTAGKNNSWRHSLSVHGAEYVFSSTYIHSFG